jgi:ubiquinone/menaquinone biosynthesis C-methylase UbiE
VLDVACGTGVVARVAAERVGSAGRVVGLDVNGAMLAVAGSLPPVAGAAVEWLEASALAMPLPDAGFDAVLCQHGLQQFPDRLAALGEMRRVLVPGGRLAVAVWGQIVGNPGMAALVDALARHVSREAADNRRRPFALGDPDDQRDLIAGAGFREVEVRTLGETARFPSPERLVEWQLAGTPAATLGALTDDVRQAVARDVRAVLEPYLSEGGLAVPMECHVGLARAAELA